MIVQSIDLLNYRNIDELHAEFSSGFNVIYGENAQGKSNLLEAIYALAFLKSFRDEKIANLIKFGSQRAVLSASVVEGNRQLRLGLEFFKRRAKPTSMGLSYRNLTIIWGCCGRFYSSRATSPCCRIRPWCAGRCSIAWSLRCVRRISSR